jgi:hypothetical protein
MVGSALGRVVGLAEGFGVGAALGLEVVGIADGAGVGMVDGRAEGAGVGEGV